MEKVIVSIVIGSYNRKAFLKAVIENIRSNGIDFAYEIIVVDGGSTDGTVQWLVNQKDIITIVQHNRGVFKGKPIERKSWGYFMNLGFKSAKGKFILMLSDDCLVIKGSIMNGIRYFEKQLEQGKKTGATAFYWRNWPEQVDYMVGLTFGKIFVNHGLYLREALEKINFADETYYHFYHGDGDLCLRLIDAGYEVIDSPDAYVEHFTHANVKVRESNFIRQKEDWDKYLARWNKFGSNVDPDGENKISKLYEDKDQTYLQFPLKERLAISLNNKKIKIKGRLSKIISGKK